MSEKSIHNRFRKKNPMIFIINAEKAFDKIQYAFLIKFSIKWEKIVFPYYHIIYSSQPKSQHHTWERITRSNLIRIENKTVMHTIIINVVLEVLVQASIQKEIYRHKIGKELKFLYADNMIPYLENPTRIILQTIR